MSGASCKNCNGHQEQHDKRFPIIVWKPFKRRDYNYRLESMWTDVHQEQHDKREISAQHQGMEYP